MPLLKIPYITFETATGKYGLDAHFFPVVEKPEHKAVLIRKASNLIPVEDDPGHLLEARITPESLEETLKSLAIALYQSTTSRFREREKHFRKWNFLRFLGIPSGYLKNLRKDDELARRSRETLLALSILEHVLGVRGYQDVGKCKIILGGYSAFLLRVEGSKILDPVYAELYKRDAGFKLALSRILKE